jgi:hypothetical protein
VVDDAGVAIAPRWVSSAWISCSVMWVLIGGSPVTASPPGSVDQGQPPRRHHLLRKSAAGGEERGGVGGERPEPHGELLGARRVDRRPPGCGTLTSSSSRYSPTMGQTAGSPWAVAVAPAVAGIRGPSTSKSPQ